MATVQVFSLLCFLLGRCLACIQCSSFLCLHHTRQWHIIAGIECQFPTVDIIAIERQRTNKIKYMRFICETSNICDMPKYFKVCVYSEKCITFQATFSNHIISTWIFLWFFTSFALFHIFAISVRHTQTHTHSSLIFLHFFPSIKPHIILLFEREEWHFEGFSIFFFLKPIVRIRAPHKVSCSQLFSIEL